MFINKHHFFLLALSLLIIVAGDCQRPKPVVQNPQTLPMSLLLTKIENVYLFKRDGNTIGFNGCHISNAQELPGLLEKCIPLYSKPSNIPKTFQYYLYIEYKGMNPVKDTPPYLLYYPEEHLLSFREPFAHEHDSWAKTTKELDDLLQKGFEPCKY